MVLIDEYEAELNKREKENISHYSKFVHSCQTDVRKIKCKCGDINCKVGIIFDDNNSKDIVMLVGEKTNHHGVYLTKETIDETIDILTNIKKHL